MTEYPRSKIHNLVAGRFKGKVALVTGSTQGLGEAIAIRLAAEGATGLVITGRNQERGEQTAQRLQQFGAKSLFVRADLGNPKDCGQLLQRVDEHFGRLDVLVNAAGLTDRGSIQDTTVELWDQIFAVNVRAPFLLIQGAVEIMRRVGEGGTIVNIGSVSSYGSVPDLLPYAASKAALIAATKNVAYAVAWDRIRVNCINPGWMDTPAEDTIQRQYHGQGSDWLSQAESRQPFGKLIKPEELAGLVAFVTSNDSGVMTGSVIDYDQSITGAGPQPVPPPSS